MSRMFAWDSAAPSVASKLPAAEARPARFAPWRFGLAWVLTALFIGTVSLAAAAPRKTQAKGKTQSRGSAKAKAQAGARTSEEATAIAGGKVAVLEFRGDDVEMLRKQVIKVLKSKGMEVSTNLRPVDTAEQYRDMGAALDLAIYVQGQIKDTGKDQAVLTIDLRSGVSGRKITSVKFSGNRRKLYADAEDELWRKVEKTFGRACVEASKAVRHHNAPMRIEAGTPI